MGIVPLSAYEAVIEGHYNLLSFSSSSAFCFPPASRKEVGNNSDFICCCDDVLCKIVDR